MVIEDLEGTDDLLLTMTGEETVKTAALRLCAWVEKHGVTKVTLFSRSVSNPGLPAPFEFVPVSEQDTLDSLMTRPVSPEDIEKFFKGSLDAVRELLAPQKIEEKFKIIGCQRYRLLTAFK
jgi:hypothetical protein